MSIQCNLVPVFADLTDCPQLELSKLGERFGVRGDIWFNHNISLSFIIDQQLNGPTLGRCYIWEGREVEKLSSITEEEQQEKWG